MLSENPIVGNAYYCPATGDHYKYLGKAGKKVDEHCLLNLTRNMRISVGTMSMRYFLQVIPTVEIKN